MKNPLLLKLFGIIAVGTVLLFWLVNMLVRAAELKMSFIADEHQQQLFSYAREAERLYQDDPQEVLAWIQALERREQTWAAIATGQIVALAGTTLSPTYLENLRPGRDPKWKIHLYFQWNPVMSVPFADGKTHFLIQLPERMRPGSFWPEAQWLLQIALPFILLCLLTLVLYRHMMKPLRQLQRATRQFSDGQFTVRVRPTLGQRRDEFAELAETFDLMAERTEQLIISQRQMLADLSHELRTPLTRVDMAVDYVEQGVQPKQALERLRYESSAMRELVEDALTLAWLDTESPRLSSDDFDLVELLTVICDDARFEHPDRQLHCQLPDEAWLHGSSHLALGQACENVIRNALGHTPAQKQVTISLCRQKSRWQLSVRDQGPGVPEHMLEDIFRPFFRVDGARRALPTTSHSAGSESRPPKRRGFGLGLALAQRQIAAVGGGISARNSDVQGAGLEIRIWLPCDNTPAAATATAEPTAEAVAT